MALNPAPKLRQALVSGPTPTVLPDAPSSSNGANPANASGGGAGGGGARVTGKRPPSLVKQALNKITQCSTRETEIGCLITQIKQISEKETHDCIHKVWGIIEAI